MVFGMLSTYVRDLRGVLSSIQLRGAMASIGSLVFLLGGRVMLG